LRPQDKLSIGEFCTGGFDIVGIKLPVEIAFGTDVMAPVPNSSNKAAKIALQVMAEQLPLQVLLLQIMFPPVEEV
jgi:hypothetical protein